VPPPPPLHHLVCPVAVAAAVLLVFEHPVSYEPFAERMFQMYLWMRQFDSSGRRAAGQDGAPQP
jgi:hypothetical protein